MNKLLIVVILIFLGCMIIGYMKGFVRIAATLGATIATIILVSLLSPIFSNVILNTIPIEKMVEDKCKEMMGVENEEGEIIIPDEVENSREIQIKVIEEAKLPEFYKQNILENNNQEIYKTLGAETFSEYIIKYLSKTLADVLSFLLTFLVATVIVKTVMYMFGIIEKLPVIGTLNRVGGFALGSVTGLIVVWVLFVVITLMYDTTIGSSCLKSISSNKILTFLYDKNILLNYITKLRG